MNECRIAVGTVVLGLECESAEDAASLRGYFATGVTEAAPDVRLRVESTADQEPGPLPDSLVATKRMAGDEFVAGGGLVRGWYRPVERRGELSVDRQLLTAPHLRLFEQLLHQAFYSARLVRHYDAVLMRGSGVVRAGAGFLFVGAAGAGKTTVADLSHGDVVLNDDICLVEFGPAGPVLRGTPLGGLYPAKRAGAAPLRAVCLLAHADAHHLAAVAAAEAVTALTGQVIAPLGLEDTLSPRISVRMLDLAGRLAATVPVKRLHFAPDAGFWRCLDDAFPPRRSET